MVSESVSPVPRALRVLEAISVLDKPRGAPPATSTCATGYDTPQQQFLAGERELYDTGGGRSASILSPGSSDGWGFRAAWGNSRPAPEAVAWHCHADTRRRYHRHMRVWELAEELHVLSVDILELIKPHDPYVTSHLANVPRQALDAIRAAPPAAKWHPGEYYDWHPHADRPAPTTGRGATPKGPPRKIRRRPGPRRVSFEPPYEEGEDGYPDDTLEELRYEPIWSTVDVAAFYRVKPATVRQWVHRGHLLPAGKVGPSYVFERRAVYAATDAIRQRRTRPGYPRPTTAPAPDTNRTTPSEAPASLMYVQDMWSLDDIDPECTEDPARLDNWALNRLKNVTPNALITTGEAAVMLGVAPATIRSWVRRGHLSPSPPRQVPASGRRPRASLFRLVDVYSAARRR